MKLYAEYIKEVFKRECEYNDYCFVTYNIYPQTKEVSIIDCYCVPEKRKSGHMRDLILGLIKKMSTEGYSKFYGYTDTINDNWQYSEKMMLMNGFKLHKIENNDTTYRHYILEIGE